MLSVAYSYFKIEKNAKSYPNSIQAKKNSSNQGVSDKTYQIKVD